MFEARQFSRAEDGTYVCSGWGGSPLLLRAVGRRGDEIDVLDGAGEQHTYRLVTLPDPRYQPRG